MHQQSESEPKSKGRCCQVSAACPGPCLDQLARSCFKRSPTRDHESASLAQRLDSAHWSTIAPIAELVRAQGCYSQGRDSLGARYRLQASHMASSIHGNAVFLFVKKDQLNGLSNGMIPASGARDAGFNCRNIFLWIMQFRHIALCCVCSCVGLLPICYAHAVSSRQQPSPMQERTYTCKH